MDFKDLIKKYEQLLVHFADEMGPLETGPGLPRDFLKKLGEHKIFGVKVPTEHGGLNAEWPVLKEFLFRLGRRSPALAMLIESPVVAAHLIEMFGNEEQRYGILPRLAKGEAFCIFTDGGTGAGPADSVPRAIAKDAGFILNGNLSGAPLAGEADYYLIPARVQEGGAEPLAVFLLEKEHPGLSFGSSDNAQTYPANLNRDLKLQQVLCSKKDLLGRSGQGGKIVHTGTQLRSVFLSTLAAAMAQAAFSAAGGHLTRGLSAGRAAAAAHPATAKLAELKVGLEAGQALVDRMWERFASEDPEAGLAIAAARVFCARSAMAAARLELELCPANDPRGTEAAQRRVLQAPWYETLAGGTSTHLALIQASLARENA